MDPAAAGQEAGVAVSAARPPFGAGKALLVFLAFYATQILVGVVFGLFGAVLYLVAHGPDDPLFVQRFTLLVTLPAALVGQLLGGAAAFLLTRSILPGTLRAGSLLPVGWRPAGRRDLLLAVLAGLGLSLVYLYGFLSFTSALPRGNWGPLVTVAMSGGWQRHTWAALLLLVAPPIEEFVFRGALFGGLQRSFGVWAGGFLTTALFLAVHLPEIGSFGPALLAISLLGVATLVARQRTQSLAPAIALHAAYNLGIVIATYVRP
jgi:membrane protease YdiL (CAAX protease family)